MLERGCRYCEDIVMMCDSSVCIYSESLVNKQRQDEGRAGHGDRAAVEVAGLETRQKTR